MSCCNSLSRDRLECLNMGLGPTYVTCSGVAVVAGITALVFAIIAVKVTHNFTIAKWSGIVCAASTGGVILHIPLAYMIQKAIDAKPPRPQDIPRRDFSRPSPPGITSPPPTTSSAPASYQKWLDEPDEPVARPPDTLLDEKASSIPVKQ